MTSRKPDDIDEMKMVLDRQNKVIEFHVNGRKVYEINNPGYRPDRHFITLEGEGPEVYAWPNTILTIFGTLEFLTHQATCDAHITNGILDVKKCKLPQDDIALIRPYLVSDDVPAINARDPTVPLGYYDNDATQENRLYGQGGITYMDSFVVKEKGL